MHTGERDFAWRGRVLSWNAVFMGPGLFAPRKTGMTVVGFRDARHMRSPCSGSGAWRNCYVVLSSGMIDLRLTRRGAGRLALAAAAAPRAVLAGPAAEAGFAALSRRYIEGVAQLSPISATTLGDHRFDAQVDDVSAAGRARRIAFNRQVLAECLAIAAADLGREAQVDRALLINQARYDLWRDEALQSWAWDPQIYSGLAGGALYGLMARDFAPMPVRLRAAIARMELLPGLLAESRAQLQPARVPRIHAETVARQNAGVVGIVDEMIKPHLAVLSPAERTRFAAADAKLRAAAAEHQAWLDKVLVPAAQGDFRLGPALYDQKLAFALQSPLSRREIRQAAEAALVSTRSEMYRLARCVLASRPGAPAAPESPDPAVQQAVIEAALALAYADHAPRDGLVAAAREALAQATAFVKARDFVTLPDAPVEVILMPEFQRGSAVAYCDAPGPLDRGQATFYAVSPIPQDWSVAQAESFLREYNRRGLHDIAVHEAMPGHYVQLWHANRHPSTLRAVLSSGPFVEGWAVYAENLMAVEGYLDHDPLFRLQQLKTRLRSISNAILDQMVHVDGASEAEVMRFLTVTAFQQEREAAGKWTRARLDSAQLPFYFVGVTEHDAVRAEAERRWGSAFTLKRYHDTVLSFGSPPMRYARALMFDEAIG